MPQKIINKFQKKYGKKKGKQIFFATAAKQNRDPETFKKESFESRVDCILENPINTCDSCGRDFEAARNAWACPYCGFSESEC